MINKDLIPICLAGARSFSEYGGVRQNPRLQTNLCSVRFVSESTVRH